MLHVRECPIFKLNNNQFSVSVKNGIINSDDCQIDFVPSEYQRKIFDTLNSAISNNAFDFNNEDESESDGDPIPTIDCKYYSIDDFVSSKFSPSKTFRCCILIFFHLVTY